MIGNLLDNAVKFSSEQRAINIFSKSNSSHFTVSVQNEGSGISPDNLDKIFDRFFRVKEKHKEVKGTGLGLTISKFIVEAHQGKIWAENSHKGAFFSFSLPFSQSKHLYSKTD